MAKRIIESIHGDQLKWTIGRKPPFDWKRSPEDLVVTSIDESRGRWFDILLSNGTTCQMNKNFVYVVFYKEEK